MLIYVSKNSHYNLRARIFKIAWKIAGVFKNIRNVNFKTVETLENIRLTIEIKSPQKLKKIRIVRGEKIKYDTIRIFFGIFLTFQKFLLAKSRTLLLPFNYHHCRSIISQVVCLFPSFSTPRLPITPSLRSYGKILKTFNLPLPGTRPPRDFNYVGVTVR